MNKPLRLVIAALLCALLAACGGGSEDEEPEGPNYGPPDCKARPEICR